MDWLWTAWLLGIVGSVHCAGMCGPLALALPVPVGGPAAYLFGRVLYNGGRVLTYALLGLLFGWLGRTLTLVGFQQGLSLGLGLLLIAGLILAPRLSRWIPVVRGVAWLKQVMGAHLRTRTWSALTILGLLNGLLPCGLVYVACAGAAATGELLAGALYMTVFGLGTVPMILAISLSGKLLHQTLRRGLTKAMPAVAGLVALLLIVRGLGLGIPYLSPDFSGSQAPACCTQSAQPVPPLSTPAFSEADPTENLLRPSSP
jgi:uncharacterized protein